MFDKFSNARELATAAVVALNNIAQELSNIRKELQVFNAREHKRSILS